MPGKKGSSHNSSSSPGMQGIWGNAINSKKEIERILAEGEHTSRDLSRDSAVWENLPTAPNTLSPYIFSSLSNNLFQFLIRRANLRFSQSLLDRGAIEFIAMYGGSAQFAAEAMGTISLPKGTHVGGLELGANLNLTPDDVGAILQSTLSRAGNASNRIAEQDVFRHTANGVALSDIADIHPSQTRELQEDLDDLFADNKSHESDEDQAKLVIAATLLACLPYVAMPLRNDAGITESLQPLSENIQRYFDMYLRLFGSVDSEGPIATQPQHPLSPLFYLALANYAVASSGLTPAVYKQILLDRGVSMPPEFMHEVDTAINLERMNPMHDPVLAQALQANSSHERAESTERIQRWAESHPLRAEKQGLPPQEVLQRAAKSLVKMTANAPIELEIGQDRQFPFPLATILCQHERGFALVLFTPSFDRHITLDINQEGTITGFTGIQDETVRGMIQSAVLEVLTEGLAEAIPGINKPTKRAEQRPVAPIPRPSNPAPAPAMPTPSIAEQSVDLRSLKRKQLRALGIELEEIEEPPQPQVTTAEPVEVEQGEEQKIETEEDIVEPAIMVNQLDVSIADIKSILVRDGLMPMKHIKQILRDVARFEAGEVRPSRLVIDRQYFVLDAGRYNVVLRRQAQGAKYEYVFTERRDFVYRRLAIYLGKGTYTEHRGHRRR